MKKSSRKRQRMMFRTEWRDGRSPVDPQPVFALSSPKPEVPRRIFGSCSAKVVISVSKLVEPPASEPVSKSFFEPIPEPHPEPSAAPAPALVRPNPWKGFAVSMIGNGHIRREMPCQDASAALTAPRGAVIVCDGRGSSDLSQEGSRAAVKAFRSQLNVLEPFVSNLLDRAETTENEWKDLCRVFYRTLVQAKLDCAEALGKSEKEFDFTAVFAIAGGAHVGCFQVGDGALVVRRNGICQTVFKPAKGEFANLTTFVRPAGERDGAFQSALIPAAEVTGLAATSDGPQYRMFNLTDMTPGPVFDRLFADLAKDELTRSDLVGYLAGPKWGEDMRGDDDRSLALLCVGEGPSPVVTKGAGGSVRGPSFENTGKPDEKNK